MRIAITTTSYQDTPGKHHELLAASGFEVVKARGPLDENAMIKLVSDGGGLDGLLNGDDAITAKVIDAGLASPRKLKVIAKYGIGLDSIDVDYATKKKVPVLFTPGVNHTTVAEHAVGLMIMLAKKMVAHVNYLKQGQWKRITGSELAGKTLGIIGLGRIGKEVAKRGRAFDMQVIAFDVYWDGAFAWEQKVQRAQTAEEVAAKADVLSLHMNLTDENRHFINKKLIETMKDGAMVINTSRGGLVSEADVAAACKSGKLLGYAADVLEHEPMQTPHEFQDVENILITPHIGSRTFESVERQALRATQNIVNFLKGERDFIQANKF